MALNYPKTIKGRVTLTVLLFGVLLLMVNHWCHQSWVTERRLARLQMEALNDASPLAGIFQHLLRRNQGRAAELELSYAALSPKLDLGIVCDRTGRVRFSTQLQWRDTNIIETPLATDWPRIRQSLNSIHAQEAWFSNENTVIVASEFYESYDATSKGIVVMRYDYQQEQEQVRMDALHEFMAQVAILVALCLLLWYALDELFMSRVAKMLGIFHGAATHGGIPHELGGSDELAMISHEFALTVKHLREAENNVLEASEGERRQIGHELHDDLCQRITATKLKAEVVHELIIDMDAHKAELAGQVADELAETALIARSMARGLSPVGLEQSGVEDALKDVARFVHNSYGAICTVICDPIHEHLSGHSQEQLFRIAQELTVNAGKHSKPTNIIISVRLQPAHVELTVRHDGKPFEETVKGARSGMGLHLLKQRIFTLSAALQRSKIEGPPEISVATVLIPLKDTASPSPTGS